MNRGNDALTAFMAGCVLIAFVFMIIVAFF